MGKATAQAAASRAGTRRRLRLWLAFIAIFMTWALYTIIHQLDNQGETKLRLAAVQQKIADSTKANEDLSRQIDRLKDPEYIQEIARKEQGMILPGEQPIQVTDGG